MCGMNAIGVYAPFVIIMCVVFYVPYQIGVGIKKCVCWPINTTKRLLTSKTHKN